MRIFERVQVVRKLEPLKNCPITRYYLIPINKVAVCHHVKKSMRQFMSQKACVSLGVWLELENSKI